MAVFALASNLLSLIFAFSFFLDFIRLLFLSKFNKLLFSFSSLLHDFQCDFGDIVYVTFCVASFGRQALPGGYSLPFYTGGPCQQFISEPQILSHSFEEPQILSLRILRP